MGTQGMVAVVRDDEVIMKIVVGYEGFNANKMAEVVRNNWGNSTIEEFYDLALAIPFGSSDCLVVVDPDHLIKLIDLGTMLVV